MRMWLWPGLANVLLALVAIPAVAGNAQLTILNAARIPDSVSVNLCATPEEDCEDLRVARDEAVAGVETPAGPHRLRVAADATRFEEFRFGIAANDRYALLLYGYGDRPVVKDWWSRAKGALGGVEARLVNRYQLDSLILPFEPGDADDRPRLRLVNLAPGLGPVSAKLDQGTHTVSLPPTKYASASPKKDADVGEGHIRIAVDTARAPMAEFELDLEAGSNHILAITDLDGHGSAKVIHMG